MALPRLRRTRQTWTSPGLSHRLPGHDPPAGHRTEGLARRRAGRNARPGKCARRTKRRSAPPSRRGARGARWRRRRRHRRGSGRGSGASSGVDVVAVQGGVGFERGQDGAHQGRVVEHFRRDAAEGGAVPRGRLRAWARAAARGWRRNCGARAPEAISMPGRGRARRRSSRASSKATTAPMLWPKKAKGRSR